MDKTIGWECTETHKAGGGRRAQLHTPLPSTIKRTVQKNLNSTKTKTHNTSNLFTHNVLIHTQTLKRFYLLRSVTSFAQIIMHSKLMIGINDLFHI
jgi:hypothetical protein